jgi:hypothetical protein
MNAVLLAAPVFAKEAREARGLCDNIERFINSRVKYTHTECVPMVKHGAVSFLLISDKPVFLDASLKKAWLIWTTGAVGTLMNAHQTIKGADVFVSDMQMRENKKSYKYPIALAKTLQEQTMADQMDVEDLYEQLKNALAPVPFPR